MHVYLHGCSRRIFGHHDGASIRRTRTQRAAVVWCARARGYRPATSRRAPFPVTFYYGTNDWMPAHAGMHVCEQLRAAACDAQTVIVDDAGHHLYLENERVFSSTLIGRVRESARRAAPLA